MMNSKVRHQRSFSETHARKAKTSLSPEKQKIYSALIAFYQDAVTESPVSSAASSPPSSPLKRYFNFFSSFLSTEAGNALVSDDDTSEQDDLVQWALEQLGLGVLTTDKTLAKHFTEFEFQDLVFKRLSELPIEQCTQ
ncbi:hypothetical protein MP638_001503 [Amoeboaphelidium occidentale]|nr:hypothetical protein MP638_001503 [Amoeboaphelidium occidentale]